MFLGVLMYISVLWSIYFYINHGKISDNINHLIKKMDFAIKNWRYHERLFINYGKKVIARLPDNESVLVGHEFSIKVLG